MRERAGRHFGFRSGRSPTGARTNAEGPGDGALRNIHRQRVRPITRPADEDNATWLG